MATCQNQRQEAQVHGCHYSHHPPDRTTAFNAGSSRVCKPPRVRRTDISNRTFFVLLAPVGWQPCPKPTDTVPMPHSGADHW